MKKLICSVALIGLAGCSWTPLDLCKRDAYFEALDLEEQIELAAKNLDRGYGVGYIESNDFWSHKLGYRNRCQSFGQEYHCHVLLEDGSVGHIESPQRVPISMTQERVLLERYTNRLGNKEEYVRNAFAACQQEYPSHVGQDEKYPGDGSDLWQ
ncbi:hypothetical protein [Yoonia sp. BS5-3]|uniref:Lipoprotein n=1 Tax=Yoonia phaeophyticola TaxID=3137369 RepID=A0ABZ2V917_9RHOB